MIDIVNIAPMDIEKESFATITRELGDRQPPAELAPIVKRVIHTTADFEYADTLYFSPNVVELAKDAIRGGAHIVTDTTMALSGINKKTLAQFGGQVHCFIADEDVAAEARERGVTRSLVSMEKAARMEKALIFAVGNAPTALQSICSLYREGKLNPEMVVGVPVGFVNVVEAKEELMQTVPDYIVARGRKGGSNVAASIVNAVLYQLVTREGI